MEFFFLVKIIFIACTHASSSDCGYGYDTQDKRFPGCQTRWYHPLIEAGGDAPGTPQLSSPLSGIPRTADASLCTCPLSSSSCVHSAGAAYNDGHSPRTALRLTSCVVHSSLSLERLASCSPGRHSPVLV